MAFHVGIAYGIAVLSVAGLAWLGSRNRRAGWQKPATNDVLDILIAWAQAKEENRQAWQESPATAPAPATAGPDISRQLGALSAALTTNAGRSPAVHTFHQEEKPTSATDANREVVRQSD